MHSEKMEQLIEAREAVRSILSKVDNLNEQFIKNMQLTPGERKAMIKAIDLLEKKVEAFFVAQKKDYLQQIGGMEKWLKKHLTSKRKKIRKAEKLSDDVLSQFAEILSECIFTNDKAHVEKLVEIYAAYTDSFFGEIVEISANAVTGSKYSPDTPLTQYATEWLADHTIKFAQEVMETTHNMVIDALKKAIVGGDGSNDAAHQLLDALPAYFNQGKISQKNKVLQSIKSADLYNKLYQEVQKSSAWEFYRSRRIARTETISAYNAATLEGWRESQVVVGKEWLCSNRKNSRDSHKNADGKKVPLDKPFLIDRPKGRGTGKDKLMHPGDSSMGADAGNVIHCCCSMAAVLRTDKYEWEVEE